MRVKAVVDRFEEDKAVLLVGDSEEQLIVERAALPPATLEGDWLQVEVKDGVLLGAEKDEDETEAVQARIAEKLARLRRGDHLKG